MKKLLKSKYSKDIVLYNLHKKYIKNRGKKEDFKTKKIVINTPFVQGRSSTQKGGHAPYYRQSYATRSR